MQQVDGIVKKEREKTITKGNAETAKNLSTIEQKKQFSVWSVTEKKSEDKWDR